MVVTRNQARARDQPSSHSRGAGDDVLANDKMITSTNERSSWEDKSGIENGSRNPTIRSVARIAKALKTTVADLCDGIDR